MNRFRLREEQARFQREEALDLERKLAPVKAELAQTLKRADRMTASYWSQPLAHLASLIHSEMFEPDRGVTYPSTTEIQDGERGRAEYTDFIANLPRSGFVLSDAGAQRLLLFVIALAYSDVRADMSNPITYRIAFDRLFQLRCFSEEAGEVGFDPSTKEVEPVEPEPERKLTVDDLENVDTTSKAGEKLAHRIIADAVFGPQGENREVFHQFIDHIAKTFGHDLTETEQRELIQWFVRNNRSFLDRAAYDTAKVNLVRRGILNHGVLTSTELFEMGIEETDTQSYESRRTLKQELAALRKPQ